MPKVWKIRGYQGLALTFELEIPENSLSEAEVENLLQRLQSRHLSDVEVVSSSLRRSASDYQSHLEVGRNRGRPFGLMTSGSDNHYIATIEDSDGAPGA